MPMFIAALFTTAKIWGQPESINGRMDKETVYIYAYACIYTCVYTHTHTQWNIIQPFKKRRKSHHLAMWVNTDGP